MKSSSFLKVAIVFLAGAVALLMVLLNDARANWPEYGTAYTLPGMEGVSVVFQVPMRSDSPLYSGSGIVTVAYPVEGEDENRAVVGVPYRVGAIRERVDLVYFVYNDLWPGRYTIFFQYAGAPFEFYFSDDKTEAVRIDNDLPLRLSIEE